MTGVTGKGGQFAVNCNQLLRIVELFQRVLLSCRECVGWNECWVEKMQGMEVEFFESI